MTRKEARKKIKNCWSYLHDGKAYINEEKIHNVIDQIYDDFEEAMKPKTCTRCFYWNDFYAKCDDHDTSLAGILDYGCNRYEPKEQ